MLFDGFKEGEPIPFEIRKSIIGAKLEHQYNWSRFTVEDDPKNIIEFLKFCETDPADVALLQMKELSVIWFRKEEDKFKFILRYGKGREDEY